MEPRRLGAPLGMAAVAVVMGLVASAAQAQMPVLRTFEDLPVGTAVFNQYDGVTFLNGDASYHPITIIAPSVATISPTQALRDSSEIPGCEFCPTVALLNFDVPQDLVSVSVGLDAVATGSSPGLTISMLAYDAPNAGGTLITQATTPCLGTQGPTAITTPIQVNDSLRRIQSVFLQMVQCQDTTFPAYNQAFVLDNLRYDRPLNPPPREHDPPIITFTTPTDASTVVGSTPGLTDSYITATITEDALYSLTASLNGHPAIAASFSRTDAHHYASSGIYITDQDGLQSGSNHACLTAVDFDRPPNTTTSCIDFTFQIKPIPPPSQVDIQPMAWEVTQSIDTGPFGLRDLDLYQNYIPGRPGYFVSTFGLGAVLLRGKPTVIRVYGAASGTTNVQTAVPAKAFVEKDNCTSGCIIASSIPPLQSPPNTPNVNGIDVPVVGTPGANLGAEAAHLSQSWNFLLQPDWTMDDLKVTVIVNDGSYSNFAYNPGVQECSGCGGNDYIEFHIHFVDPPQITVHPVPIHVSGTYLGTTFTDVQPTQAQIDRVFEVFNELYPGRVNQGTSIDLTPSGGDNFAAKSHDDFLNLITDRFGDGAPNEFYLGLFPSDQGVFQANDVNGVSYVGTRAVFAKAARPVSCAHETAHAIGFDHWACEFGAEANDECSVFPIPHGGTGVYSFDVAGWRVIPPGDNSGKCTLHAHDFMSYGHTCDKDCSFPCNLCVDSGCVLDRWVSWYDYDILFHHMTVDSYDTDDPPALLVSGTIDATGFATMRPFHQTSVNHPITDTIADEVGADIYTIQGYDSRGNTLFVHNFAPHENTTHNAVGRSFRFDEPVPVVPNLGSLEVFRNADSIGYVFNVGYNQPPTVSVTAPAGGATWTGGPQTITWTESSPVGLSLVAMVRYSPDGGATRVTLGRDVPGTSLTIDSDQLAGSTNALIFVDVSDGFNGTTAMSGPFTVAPKPPRVHITSPHAGAVLQARMPLSLEGTAADRQGPLTAAQLVWTSSRDGVLGTGSQLTVMSLTPGVHILTLTATDAQALTGSDSIDVLSVAPGTEDTGLVPPDKTALKCEGAIASRYGKLATSVFKCHGAAAATAVGDGHADEEGCETGALATLQARIGKLKPTCPAYLLSGALGFGSDLVSFLDQHDDEVFCAGSTPLGDEGDTGFVPPDRPTLKCEAGAAKAAGKLAAAIVTCHKKMAVARFQNGTFDEEGCEHAAATHFDAAVGRLKGCPPCVAQDAAALRDAIASKLDGANGGIYCAGTVAF